MTTQANILEIFPSIQGEGKYAGVPQVFVRFFECNMHCVWCDTPASIGDTTRNYKEMSLEDVFRQVKEIWQGCHPSSPRPSGATPDFANQGAGAHSVSLTGGEPLLQKDFIKALLPLLKREGMRTYLETNGVLPDELQDIIDDIDMIAMDIKLPSSTQCKPYWDEHARFLEIGKKKDIFIKAVISSQTDKEDIVKAVEVISRVNPATEVILQPNTFDLKNGVMPKCLEYQRYCLARLPNTRILPQMHKFMKLR